ncbi:hypothetical protein DM02DRAFT_609216 [Periconia macrospinosa]|uniref:Uncharacterized protein n=1 Tax=Periconia macrospinosa TaxID=97972 RepID=A0A2V1ED22_9PLEO|nr:hypothetical protein DM02DRAFT_609216 [Periconia macrospinosa]
MESSGQMSTTESTFSTWTLGRRVSQCGRHSFVLAVSSLPCFCRFALVWRGPFAALFSGWLAGLLTWDSVV